MHYEQCKLFILDFMMQRSDYDSLAGYLWVVLVRLIVHQIYINARELDLMILMGPFKLEIFYDIMILWPHLNKAVRFVKQSGEFVLPQTHNRIFHNKPQFPTWSKVHCCIKTLKSSTSQVKLACTISCEQHHLIPKMLAEELQKETQIVIVASEVASILILYLRSKSKSVK